MFLRTPEFSRIQLRVSLPALSGTTAITIITHGHLVLARARLIEYDTDDHSSDAAFQQRQDVPAECQLDLDRMDGIPPAGD